MENEKTSDSENANNAAACIEAGERIGRLESKVQAMEVHGEPAVAIPEGLHVEYLEKFRENPRRINREISFNEIESFCSYVRQFLCGSTRIYGVTRKNEIQAVLDDHVGANNVDRSAELDPKARWCGHLANLDLQPSDEWSAWTGKNRQPQGHVEFCEFLREHLAEIASPDAAELLQAARAFSTVRSAKFEQVVAVGGGDISVAFSEELRGATKSGSATLPDKLLLVLRPYRFGAAYQVEAVINWRLKENQLTFSFTLLSLDRVLEQAFAAVRAKVKEMSGLDVLV